MRMNGLPWVALAAVFLMVGCQEEEEVSDAVPGDANAGALAIAVDGKVFAKASEPADEVSGGDTRPSPKPSPTPEPSPSPPSPDEVTVAIFSDFRTGEACLSYGVYEPDTGRKTFVTATCSLNTVADYLPQDQEDMLENHFWTEGEMTVYYGPFKETFALATDYDEGPVWEVFYYD